MKDKLVIIGASGHGKVVADVAALTGKYKEIVFLDDADCSKQLGNKYLGKSNLAANLIEDYEFFVAIGNSKIREKLMNLYKNAEFAILIHPSAVISRYTSIGKGTVVMAGAVINADSIVGDGVIINTCSSVDHDCYVGSFSHIAVGSHLCGTVNVGRHTWIGAGATVINNIDICSNCTIGAGTVVIKNIEKSGTYIGVPARLR
jgi:sugar O-acyltransferase (sialic acid O-acetyltransferase NeuD family)